MITTVIDTRPQGGGSHLRRNLTMLHVVPHSGVWRAAGITERRWMPSRRRWPGRPDGAFPHEAGVWPTGTLSGSDEK